MRPTLFCILALCIPIAATAASQLEEVTPPAPIFLDPDGEDIGQPTIIFPGREGVDYAINGVLLGWEGDWYPDSNFVTVTAVPWYGYCFPANAVTLWTHTFSAPTPTMIPSPDAPQFIDPANENEYGYVFVPGYSETIVYRLNNNIFEGDYYFPAGTTITVTAEHGPGFCFPSDAVTEWTHTFRAPETPPAPPPGPLSSLDIAASTANGQISAGGGGSMNIYLGETVSISSTAAAACWLSEHNIYGYTPGPSLFSIPNGTAMLEAMVTTTVSARTVT